MPCWSVNAGPSPAQSAATRHRAEDCDAHGLLEYESHVKSNRQEDMKLQGRVGSHVVGHDVDVGQDVQECVGPFEPPMRPRASSHRPGGRPWRPCCMALAKPATLHNSYVLPPCNRVEIQGPGSHTRSIERCPSKHPTAQLPGATFQMPREPLLSRASTSGAGAKLECATQATAPWGPRIIGHDAEHAEAPSWPMAEVCCMYSSAYFLNCSQSQPPHIDVRGASKNSC